MPDAIANARQVIANAQTLGQKYALNLGIEDYDRWVDWCKVLADAAAFGQERGVKVVVKHHHGLQNTSMDLIAWTKQVNHPNFGLFFDPGNVVYYTGKDPVKDLELIGPYVSGVVAKDCSAPHFMERAAGDPPFGEKVDRRGEPGGHDPVRHRQGRFRRLLQAAEVLRFQRPRHGRGDRVGATLEETIANARANREFLEKVFAGT